MNEPEGFNPAEPNIARVWDYLLGGKNHYPADRAEAERLLAIEPRLGSLAKANRGFLRRAVDWLVLDCGVRQFLDLGSGLPAAGTVHEVAQAAASSSRVVYVDNDPVAAVHAAALLAHGNQQVGALRADLADPVAVLASPEVAGVLDLTRPAAAIFGMVLNFFDAAQADKIISSYMAELAPGSYVVISCGSGDEATGGRLAREYQPGQLRNHSREQILGFLDDLELIDPPGLADAWSWAPGVPCLPPSQHGAHVLAAVARTPLHPHPVTRQRDGRAATRVQVQSGYARTPGVQDAEIERGKGGNPHDV